MPGAPTLEAPLRLTYDDDLPITARHDEIARLVAEHPVVVVATGVVLAATLTLIRDLDQPYAGALERSPSQTEFIRAQIAPEVRGPLPCDDGGMPTRAPDFRASTSALR